MEQSADGSGALHGIGQPGKQRKLRALADNAAENQKGAKRDQILGHTIDACGVIEFRNAQIAEAYEKQNQTEEEANVSDPVHYEGLLACLGCTPFLVVKTYQKI